MRLGILMTVGILEKLMRWRTAPFPPLSIPFAPCVSFQKPARQRWIYLSLICKDAHHEWGDANNTRIQPDVPRDGQCPLLERTLFFPRDNGIMSARASRKSPRVRRETHFTSTVAPASVNFFLIASASSLLTPSLIGLGALSTKSLASFNPRLVTSRTALITLILLEPTAVRTTLNSVFSSAGAAPAAPPGAPVPAATTTGAAAAALTPSVSASFFTSSAAS